MKPYFILMIATMFLVLPACEKTEETIDKIDHALDRNPYEKIRDAAEDIGDEIKGFVTEIHEEADEIIE